MSARQVRRLEALATLGGSSGSESDGLPDTMQAPRRRKKEKKRPSAVPDEALESVSANVSTAPGPEPGAGPGAGPAQPSRRGPRKKAAPKPVSKAVVSKRRPRGNAVAQESDDEFEAVLAAFGHEGGAGAGSSAPAPHAATEALLRPPCDVSRLDAQAERTAAFGAPESAPRPVHPGMPRFKVSRFATPDPHTWPRFDGLGATTRCTVPAAAGAPAEYDVDDSDASCVAAQRQLDAVVAMAGGVDDLFQLWQRRPYHLPTLIQLHYAFTVMGDSGQAQRTLDMALYAVGSALSGFPLDRPHTARTLPYRGGSRSIYAVLLLGVHAALKRGCAKTALERLRLLLSLSPDDPLQAELLVDFVALRAAAWGWLLDRHTALEAEEHPLRALPSVSFGVALAAFFMERAGKKPAVPAAAAAEAAVRRFPAVALSLARRANDSPVVAPWDGLTDVRDRGMRGASAASTEALSHVGELVAERLAELWKLPGAHDLLRAAAVRVSQDADDVTAAAAAARAAVLADGFLEQYLGTTPEAIMGQGPKAIPRELLDTEPEAPPVQGDLLERLEAVFGPLPDATGPERQARYLELLEEEMRRVGDETNALALFFQTLLPGNTPEELAVRRAMERQGVADPVAARRRQERDHAAAVEPEFEAYSESD